MFMQTIVHIQSPNTPSRSGMSSSLVVVITSWKSEMSTLECFLECMVADLGCMDRGRNKEIWL